MSTDAIERLARNAVHLLPEGGLAEKLRQGRPLRVKLGIDVTSPDIHVGRAIPLQRMRAFQDDGHLGVLIIGDYTTRIGDPSGRSAERPVLSGEEIDRNARTYVEQAMIVLDPERTEVRYNGEWLARLDFAEILRLTRTTTVSSASALIGDDQSGAGRSRRAGRGRRGGRPLDRCEERLSYRQAVRERAHVVDVGCDTGPSGPQAGHRQRAIRVDGRRDPGTFIPETQAAQEEVRRLEPVGEDERVGGMPDIADLDGLEAGLAPHRGHGAAITWRSTACRFDLHARGPKPGAHA